MKVSGGAAYPIKRVGDYTLQYEYKDKARIGYDKNVDPLKKGEHTITRHVRIHVPTGNTERFDKIQALMERIIDVNKMHGNKILNRTLIDPLTKTRWKIVRKSSFLTIIARILKFFNLLQFFHLGNSPAKSDYVLKEDRTFWQWLTRRSFIDKLPPSHRNMSCEVTADETAKGLGYDDALTKVSTLAYQKYEHDYRGQDGKEVGAINSDYAILMRDGHVRLATKAEARVNREQAVAALEHCKQQYENLYGREKLKYAEYQAKFNLDEMIEALNAGRPVEPLTPEHVYRLNVLLNSVESQDISSLLGKLLLLNAKIQGSDVDGTALLKDQFAAWREEGDKIFSAQEVHGILMLAAKQLGCDADEVTVGGMREMVGQYVSDVNLDTGLQLLKSVVLAVDENERPSLREYLGNNENIAAVWTQDQLERLIEFVETYSGKEEFDLKEFQKAIQFLYIAAAQFQSTSIRIDDKDAYQKLEAFVNENLPEDGARGEEIAGAIVNLISSVGPHGRLRDVLADQMKDLSQDLSVELYGDLINVYRPDQNARDKAYTGRKVELPVTGYYTTADHELYKPWLDQQELQQINGELEQDTLTDPYTNQMRPMTQEEKQRAFDEKCAFIICKKHLFKQHPTEGYRIGELIPAPSRENGEKRWYRVSRMTAGHEGLMYYVLEPVGFDSGLSTCLLARSTAASTYAYEGEASFRNDVNPINPPGYDGMKYLKPSLEMVRKEHTIPAWVAYQYSAQKKLGAAIEPTEADVQDIESRLERASSELEKDFSYKHKHKNLHQIVREFDTEFNDVIWRSASLGNFLVSITCFKWCSKGKSKYDRILMKYAHNFTKNALASETPAQKTKRERQERKDALFMMNFIKKHAPRNENKEICAKYQVLINAIGDHIFHDDNSEFIKRWENQLSKVGYAGSAYGWKDEAYRLEEEALSEVKENLDQYREQFANALTTEEQVQVLMEWEGFLRQHAELLGEDVASKKTNGIRVLGHSLGGSTAEVEAYALTAGSNRLPIPGTTISARLYDDPGMSGEDNSHQYEFIIDHKQIMQELGATMKVYRSHEFGDFIPTGSTGHLGGLCYHTQQKLKQKSIEAARNDDEGLTQELLHTVIREYGTLGLTHEEIKVFKDLSELNEWDDEQQAEVDALEAKVVEAFNRETGLNIESFETLRASDFLTNSFGRKLIFQCYMRDIHSVFKVQTELKNATSYALEPETGDTAFKHGTRFESTRREKTGVLKVVNKVGTKALAVNIRQDMRLLGDYVERTFPRAKDGTSLSDFKELFTLEHLNGLLPPIALYLEPELCVKVAAKAYEDRIEIADIISDPNLVEELRNASSGEAKQYLELRQAVALGYVLSSTEKECLKKLGETYDSIYDTACKLRKQAVLIEALKPLATRRIAKARLEHENPGKHISTKQIDKLCKTLVPIEDDLIEAADALLRDFQNEMNELEALYRQSYEAATSKEAKTLRKQANTLRSTIFNTYVDLLTTVKTTYEAELEAIAKAVRNRAAGGVRIVHVSREGLGDLSGAGKVDQKVISNIWGFGALRTRGMESFRRFVGTSVAPTFSRARFKEKIRVKNMIDKGHGDTLKYRDPFSNTFTVDHQFGVLMQNSRVTG